MKNVAANVAAQAPRVTQAWVGIDIAKQTVDACLLRGEGPEVDPGPHPVARSFDDVHP